MNQRKFGIVILILGLVVIIISLIVFKSGSNWGSLATVIGLLVSLEGLAFIIKDKPYKERLIIYLTFFVVVMCLLLLFDYVLVKNKNIAPRYSKNIVNVENTTYYDTFFYDVIKCTDKESFKIIKNTKYNDEIIINYCNK